MPRSIATRASPGALALLCVTALPVALPLARGGVHLASLLAAAVVAALAAALADRTQPGRVPAAALPLAVVTLHLGLQLVPLPPAALALISPAAAGLFETHLRPLGLYPAPRPLTLDAPATARALATAGTCLCAMFAASRLSSSRAPRERILAAVALAGTAVAGVGLAAAAAARAPLTAPRVVFVNPNHLAGFLNLTAFTCLGFAVRPGTGMRALWLMAFAVSGAGVFLSLSRGGIAAFVAGAGAFGVLYVRRLRTRSEPGGRWRHLVVPAALALVVAIAAALALDGLVAEARTAGGAAAEWKLRMVPLGLAMLRDFPVSGIGRGAFATVFPAYNVEPYALTFTHLENEWLQPLVDLGIPMGILLVGTFAWLWIRAARAPDLSRPEMGAVAGVLAIAVHGAVDFSLELPGVAVPFAVLAGALARTQPEVRAPPWLVRTAATVVVVLGVAATWACGSGSLERDTARLAAAADAGDAIVLARGALSRHPADYLPHAVAGAHLAVAGRCAEALPWLVRAMGRNPTAPEPHRHAARCLATGGRHAEAKREYRLASLMGDPRAIEEALRQYPDLRDVLDVVPDVPAALVRAGSFLACERPSHAAVVLERAWTDYGDTDALAALAPVLLAQRRADDALAAARRLQDAAPGSPAGWISASTALAALGRSDDAHAELERGAERLPGSAPILVPLVRHAIEARRFAEALRLARSIAGGSASELATKDAVVAEVARAAGRAAAGAPDPAPAGASRPDGGR